MTKKNHSPNDMRSIVKNPNSKEHAADQANRAHQVAENAPATTPATPGSSQAK